VVSGFRASNQPSGKTPRMAREVIAAEKWFPVFGASNQPSGKTPRMARHLIP